MTLCACGCDGEIPWKPWYKRKGIPKYIRGHNYRGENNPNYGRTGKDAPMYDVHRNGKDAPNWKGGKITKNCLVCGREFQVKLSKEHLRKCCSRSCQGNYQTGENNPMFGRTGEKNPFYGNHHSEEHKQRVSERHKGKKLSEESKKKISDANTGRKLSEESKRKMSASHQNIPYDEWVDYATDKPYCPLFDEKCRESNRDKYGRKCFICGLPASENITTTGKQQRLSVHHIDMDKGQGCDGKRWKLVPVCIHHHKTLHNDLWISRVIYLLENCNYNDSFQGSQVIPGGSTTTSTT